MLDLRPQQEAQSECHNNAKKENCSSFKDQEKIKWNKFLQQHEIVIRISFDTDTMYMCNMNLLHIFYVCRE